MVSLKDIAQRCGVSTATVSKALHDQKDIGAETKNRIKKIAKEMGYLPNAAARVLKTKESNNIGVLYFDEAAMGLTHEYFAGHHPVVGIYHTFILFANVWHKSKMTCSLDCYCKSSLVLCTVSCDTAWKDFSSLRDVSL